ncbi:hypothetical protein, partial [Streptomyces sp. NPDC127574]|uniref:hypothetical protein n=1 Tax=Streptomyces sp. NPDC127574 TaxID=3345401 RepID=UPI003637343D
MVVAHSTPKTSDATPAPNMAPAISQTGAATLSRAIGRAAGKVHRTATRRGRRTRTRAASPAPATVPTACAATMTDQALAPPKCCSAVNGPR